MTKTHWPPQHILVGIDGSDQATRAAETAADMARTNGARLTIMTVVRPPEGWWGIVGTPPTATAMARMLESAQRDVLDAVEKNVDLSGVTYELVEEIGDPAAVLSNYTLNNDVDLVILGRQGAGLLERIMIGSVANRVSHKAPSPVMLIP